MPGEVGCRDLVSSALFEEGQPCVVVPCVEDIRLGVEEVFDFRPGDQPRTCHDLRPGIGGGHERSRPSRKLAGRSPLTDSSSPKPAAESQYRQKPRIAPSSTDRPCTPLTSSAIPRDISL